MLSDSELIASILRLQPDHRQTGDHLEVAEICRWLPL